MIRISKWLFIAAWLFLAGFLVLAVFAGFHGLRLP
jgi:hypothetical protein